MRMKRNKNNFYDSGILSVKSLGHKKPVVNGMTVKRLEQCTLSNQTHKKSSTTPTTIPSRHYQFLFKYVYVHYRCH